jgi:Protein of unknown function (DUF4054)
VITLPVYNDANFREQFPAFASETAYPPAALEFAWNMGANWVSQTYSASWGIGSSAKRWQQAADLMGAVVVYQLYGPSVDGESQTPSQTGEAPGPVTGATEGSVSAQFQIPDVGDSAFNSMLLASPPYGRMLLALLQISASVGPYIPSRRPAWIPP